MMINEILAHYGLPAATAPNPVCDVDASALATLAQALVNEQRIPLRLMFATDERATRKAFAINAVFSKPSEGYLTLRAMVPATDPRYPSVTAFVMAAHWYERLMNDQFGIIADGHPDWRRLEHHQNIPANTFPLQKDFVWNTKLAHANEPYPMHAVEGDGIYEIPVGPIHAGIIEPGHFRFNVRGERILTLEGKLFFKHKGVEKLLEGKTITEAMPYIEQVSGDSSVGYALAFVQAVEKIAGLNIPKRAASLRVVWAELERITMHVFDIANIGGNGTGLSFMGAQGFRVLEILRRLAQQVSGHRFWRSMIVAGGVSKDVTREDVDLINKTLNRVERELTDILRVAHESDGLRERLETTGVLKHEAGLAYGALGLPARASGIDIDTRRDHAYAGYAELEPRVMTEMTGDVRARFDLRGKEIAESLRLIRTALANMPAGAVNVPVNVVAGESLGWSEGWRGEILDWVRLDADGRIERCVVRDPSFCNWALFGEIGPGNIVPDFPLCNKSLNLSYSGTDL